MSPAIRALLLSCLACALGCTVPTIEQLGEQYPIEGSGKYVCNDEYPNCPKGMMCIEGSCLEIESLACIPGTKTTCGPSSDKGVCVVGEKECGVDATYDACVGAVLPKLETCGDRVDSDCDGFDDVFASKYKEAFKSRATVASAFLPDSGTLFVATVEGGELVIRSRGPGDEALIARHKVVPPRGEILHPRLMAEPRSVVVAWVESESSKANKPQVFLARLSDTGVPMDTVFPMPYATGAAEDNHVADLAVAATNTHIFVFTMTSDVDTMTPVPPPTAMRRTWRSVVNKDLKAPAVAFAGPFAHPRVDFELFATPNSSRTLVHVAFENDGVRKSYLFKNDGETEATSYYTEPAAETHSRFILPTPGTKQDHRLFYVRINPQSGMSELVSVTCQERGTTIACNLDASPLLTLNSFIQRAQLLLPPDMPATPKYALVSLRGSAGTGDSLSLFKLGEAGTPSPFMTVSNDSVVEAVSSVRKAEALHHVVFLRRLDKAPDPSLDAHHRSFCLP